VNGSGSGPLREQASQAERTRLKEVILDWLLRVDRERKFSFTVETTEQDRIYAVAGLELKLRIDRIDRLKNGGLVLIDYKSGEPSASHLDRERPKEPQILVYAAALGSEVEGLFFAQLKPRDPRLVGYSRQLHISDRKSKALPNWQEFLEDRRAIVEQLAEGFATGEAAVHPLKGACEYCRAKPLCRVNERRPDGDDPE
jgi:RecB family exonuclease